MIFTKNFFKICLLTPALLLSVFAYSKPLYAFTLLPISVTSVAVDQSKVYEVGQIVQGKFVVQSASEEGVVYDLKYNVAIMEGGIPGKPTVVYDRTPLFDARIVSGDNSFNFDYKIPQALPKGKNLLIQIQLFRTDGTPLDWAYAPIKINESSISSVWVEIQNAVITVKGEQYGLGAGPTIYNSREGYLAFDAVKTNETGGNLFFTYSIHDFSSTGKVVKTESIPISFLKNNASIKMELPFLSGGMYFGNGAIYTESNQKISRDFSFKYIIDGDIYKIRSLELNTLRSGKVTISGKPVDTNRLTNEDILNGSSTSEFKALSVSVSVEDDGGQMLSEGKTTVSVGNADIDTSVSLKDKGIPLKTEGYVLAKVSIARNGNVIDTYEQKISLPLSIGDGSVSIIDIKTFALGYGFLFALYLCVALLCFLILRRFIGTQNARVVSIVVLVFLLGISVFFLKSVYAKTTRAASYMQIVQSDLPVLGVPGVLDPTITYFVFQSNGANAPLDNQYGYKLNPGQKFNVSVGIFSWRCLNRYHAFLTEVFTGNQKSKGEHGQTVPGQGGTHYYAPQGDTLSDYQTNSSFGTFTAPEKPGFYDLVYDIENLQYSSTPWGGGSYDRTGVVTDFETKQMIFRRSDYKTYWLRGGKTMAIAYFVVLCEDGSLPISGCNSINESNSTSTTDGSGSNNSGINGATEIQSCDDGYIYSVSARNCVLTACLTATDVTTINPITGECYCTNDAIDPPVCTKLPDPLGCNLPNDGGMSVSHGQKIKMYEKALVGREHTCSEYMAELTCFNGALYKPPFNIPKWAGPSASVAGETNSDSQYKYTSCRVVPGYNEL